MGLFRKWLQGFATVPKSDDFEITVTVDGVSYVSGMGELPSNPDLEVRIKAHIKKLLTIYKRLSSMYPPNADIAPKLIKKIYPQADQHTCPYCGVVHPFTAARARKCPDCGQKMIVRNGTFLKESQAEEFQCLIADYYDKTQELERLKHSLQSTQDNMLRKIYGRSFLDIADAYESCAIIHDQSYEGGFTAWDYAWGILNNEVLKTISTVNSSQRELLSNGYAEIIFARGMHCLREVKHDQKDKARNRHARIAIAMFYDYLLGLNAHDLNDWHMEDALKNIHIAIRLGNVSKQQLHEVAEKISDRQNYEVSPKVLNKVMRQVNDYVLVEEDPERLKWMIY